MDRFARYKELLSKLNFFKIFCSGGNNFNTILKSVSLAVIINKELKTKDRKFRKLPNLKSGRANKLIGQLARQCVIPFSGITIGTHSRKIVKSELGFEKINPYKNNIDLINAVKVANDLIGKF